MAQTRDLDPKKSWKVIRTFVFDLFSLIFSKKLFFRGKKFHNFIQLLFVLELPHPVGLYPLNEDTLKDMVSNKIEMKNADVSKGPGGKIDPLFHSFNFALVGK